MKKSLLIAAALAATLLGAPQAFAGSYGHNSSGATAPVYHVLQFARHLAAPGYRHGYRPARHYRNRGYRSHRRNYRGYNRGYHRGFQRGQRRGIQRRFDRRGGGGFQNHARRGDSGGGSGSGRGDRGNRGSRR